MLKVKSKPAKRSPVTRKKSATSPLAKAQAKSKARHEKALSAVKDNRPPQAWFDQNDCPFTPTKR